MKKYLRIMQRDASDCAAACIASLCSFYKMEVSVARIRQYAHTDQNGTNVLGVVQACKKLGLDAKGVKASAESLSELPFPAIAHTIINEQQTHFVVIVCKKKNHLMIMDPSVGATKKISQNEFLKTWTGVLILAVPGDSFRTAKGISNIKRFWNLARPHKKAILSATLTAMIISVLGLSMSIYVREIIDRVLARNDLPLLNNLSVVMVLLVILQVYLSYKKDITAIKTSQAIDSGLVLGYYRHLLKLPQAFFDNMKVGEIMSRVNDAIRISSFISEVAINIMVNTMIVLFSLSLMVITNWKLAILSLCILPFYTILGFCNDIINKKWQRRQLESVSAFDGQLVESLAGIGTIKRIALEENALEKTENKFRVVLKTIYRSLVYQLYVFGAMDFFTKIFSLALLWTGSYFVVRKYLSAGELISFYSLMIYFTTPMTQLMLASRSVREALIAADRLFELTDLEIEKTGTIDMAAIPAKSSSIVFTDVHFGYGNKEAILKGVNFTIPANSITGIKGVSGSGKSTIAALLQKLYTPASGKITLGDVDIQYINNESLRKIVGSVPQQSFLFSGSVAENISIGDPEPDMHRILHLAEKLGITEFVSQLAGGFHSIITERSTNFSGGQQQMLAIARALYRQPVILILDEASSAIDEVAEKNILEAIKWYRLKGNTILIIAHRDSTLKICDNVLTLSNGQII